MDHGSAYNFSNLDTFRALINGSNRKSNQGQRQTPTVFLGWLGVRIVWYAWAIRGGTLWMTLLLM